MGGVNHNDQLRGYYHVHTKGRKYLKYLFWLLFNVGYTNTYILAKDYSNCTVCRMKAFRRNLAMEPIGSYANRKRQGRPALLPSRRVQSNHFPVKGGSNQGYRCHYRSWRRSAATQYGSAKSARSFSAILARKMTAPTLPPATLPPWGVITDCRLYLSVDLSNQLLQFRFTISFSKMYL